MPFPFEVDFEELQSDLDAYVDAYVDAVFGCLESEFLVIPKGKGFVEFPVFEHGYEALKRATGGFREVTLDTVAPQSSRRLSRSSIFDACWGSRRRNGPTSPLAKPASM